MSKLVSDTAMLMAAGLGKRMRPLTAATPKPLVRVAGKPLIDRALDRLEDAGVAKAVVNVHYLADAIEAHVGQRKSPATPKPLVRVAGKPLIDRALDRLEDAGVAKAVVNVHYLADAIEAHVGQRKAPAIGFSDERELLLETGGGMVKAQGAGQLPDPFFACNADSIWLDGPRNAFLDLSARWDPDKMDALLLVVSHARAFNFDGTGDFYLDGVGRLSRKQPGRIAPFIYTGIQIVSHRLLREAPEGKFSTNVLWDRAIEEGRLFGLAFTGHWYEVGTPAHIRPTEEALRGG